MSTGNSDSKKLVVDVTQDRSTKNMIRWEELVEYPDEPLIRTLYLRKDAVRGLGNPQFLRITIEPLTRPGPQ